MQGVRRVHIFCVLSSVVFCPASFVLFVLNILMEHIEIPGIIMFQYLWNSAGRIIEKIFCPIFDKYIVIFFREMLQWKIFSLLFSSRNFIKTETYNCMTVIDLRSVKTIVKNLAAENYLLCIFLNLKIQKATKNGYF